MATTKLYDLVVKTGEYQNGQGETKARYENIGAVMRNENGQFAMIKRTFNPAGINSDRDSILVSMFEPRQQRGSGPSGGYGNNQGQQSGGYDQSPDGYGGGSGGGFDDEIPFAPIMWP